MFCSAYADFHLPDKEVNIGTTFNEKFTPEIMPGDVGDKRIPFFNPIAVPLMLADEASMPSDHFFVMTMILPPPMGWLIPLS